MLRPYVNTGPAHPVFHFAIEEGALHSDTEHMQSFALHFDRCTYVLFLVFFLKVCLVTEVLLCVIFSSCITSEVSGPVPKQMNVRHLLGFQRAMSNLNEGEVGWCWEEALLKAS